MKELMHNICCKIHLLQDFQGICVSRPPTLALALGPGAGPQFVFTGLGFQFAFSCPGLQIVFTSPGPQFVFTISGNQFLFDCSSFYS